MTAVNHSLTEKESALLQQLTQLVSESRNPASVDIDLLSTQSMLEVINQEDQKVPLAVQAALPAIADAVEAIVEAFKQAGRLIYIGAGTSGRLGILDAVECPPTFSVEPSQVVGIIAGGSTAIYQSIEGAEDNEQAAIDDLNQIKLTANDVVVGIAASGRTPYVISALNYANRVGSQTVTVTCNPDAKMLAVSNIGICAEVGPEVLTGSTRLKSGTAQKLILNMLTTAAMIKSGKCYQNLMVDVNASNEKLIARASRIVIEATGCSHAEAKVALEQADNSAKLAILIVLTGVCADKGKTILNQCNGQLRAAIAAA